MAAPTFTQSTVEGCGRSGECVIEMVMSSGYGSGPAEPQVPTEGQLWPRGNS